MASFWPRYMGYTRQNSCHFPWDIYGDNHEDLRAPFRPENRLFEGEPWWWSDLVVLLISDKPKSILIEKGEWWWLAMHLKMEAMVLQWCSVMFSARFQELLEISIQPDLRAILRMQASEWGCNLKKNLDQHMLIPSYSKLFDTAVLVIPSVFRNPWFSVLLMNAMQCILYTSPLCRCCNYLCCSSNNGACKTVVVGIIYSIYIYTHKSISQHLPTYRGTTSPLAKLRLAISRIFRRAKLRAIRLRRPWFRTHSWDGSTYETSTIFAVQFLESNDCVTPSCKHSSRHIHVYISTYVYILHMTFISINYYKYIYIYVCTYASMTCI